MARAKVWFENLSDGAQGTVLGVAGPGNAISLRLKSAVHIWAKTWNDIWNFFTARLGTMAWAYEAEELCYERSIEFHFNR